MSPAPPVRTEIEADAADARHREELDRRLRDAIDGGATDWTALLRAAEGADPRLVAHRLRDRGWSVAGVYGPQRPSDAPPAPRARWSPELHARDFEWYFTPECARALATRLADEGGSVLCLGSPTVAFAMLDHAPRCRVTLVDRNPLIARRHPRASSLESIYRDLADVRLPAGRYDAVVFDAPWYPAALRHWMTVAGQAARPGGRIWFALLPGLHRPRAREDREAILSAARQMGPVELRPAALRYHSPRFEREAIGAGGLVVPDAWRVADLVELEVRRPPAPLDVPPAPPPDEWTRFVLGDQVIHLDPHVCPEPGDALAPVDGSPDFRYRSISTRDPRRARIGLWTSRSRVARVGRPDLVAALLDRLCRSADYRALDDARVLAPLEPSDRHRVLQALRTVLGPS